MLPDMTEAELQIEAEAYSYAQKHRTRIANRLVDTSVYLREECPLTVFMAGSPGAGKTEVSKNFVRLIAEMVPDSARVLRIDPDEFRAEFPAYTGDNSWLFQKAVIKVLQKVLDRAFSKSVSFLLDGTLSSLPVAQTNIRRALSKQCIVRILYVYQNPTRAWQFVQDREVAEGRNIPLDAFVTQYFAARRNVQELKREFGDQIGIDLLMQSENQVDNGVVEMDVTAELIDELLPEPYDESTLYQVLSKGGEYDNQN